MQARRGRGSSSSNTVGSEASAIAISADGNRLVATTTNGGIFTSTDTGATWLKATNVPSLLWTAVTCSADGSKLVAAGKGGGIYSSVDFGMTWSSNTAPNGQWSSVVSSANGNRLVATCNFGIFVAPPNDLSISQTASPVFTAPGSNVTFTITVTNLGPADALGVTVTDTLTGGASFLSSIPTATTNGGRYIFNLGTLTNAASATITIQATAMATGQFTNVAKVSAVTPDPVTSNNTANGIFGIYLPTAQVWAKTAAPAESPQSNFGWQSVAIDDEGKQLLAAYTGLNGELLVSHDAGATWVLPTPPQGYLMSGEWLKVACNSDGQVLLAGMYGAELFISTNAGRIWQVARAPGYWAPIAVSRNGNTLMASDEGYLTISTNRGASWNAATNAPFGPEYLALSASGQKMALIAGDTSIYTSTDWGATWNQATNATTFGWTGIASSADGTRLVAVTGGSIYLSLDSGTTWNPATNAPNQPWTGIACSADGAKLFAMAGYGQIYSSADYGATWVTMVCPVAAWIAIACNGDGTKLVVANSSEIWISRPPVLNILSSGINLIVQWPSSYWSFVLQQTSDILAPGWADVLSPYADDGTNKSFLFNSTTNSQFFRLRQ